MEISNRINRTRSELYIPSNDAKQVVAVESLQTEVRVIVLAETTGVAWDFFSAGGAEGGIARGEAAMCVSGACNEWHQARCRCRRHALNIDSHFRLHPSRKPVRNAGRHQAIKRNGTLHRRSIYIVFKSMRDQPAGTSRLNLLPLPGELSTWMEPPRRISRSRMLKRPKEVNSGPEPKTAETSNPHPASRTSISI
jgi:hypothetical protein